MKLFPHGGNLRSLAQTSGKDTSQIIDFSANINPLGPPAWLRQNISSAISGLIHYPDPDSSEFRQAVAGRYNCSFDETLVGNGSTELIYMVPRVMARKKAIIAAPSYADYATACAQAGMEIHYLLTKPENDFRLDVSWLDDIMHGDELVFLGNPNNPTGTGLDRGAILDLALKYPDSLFVIDEAFCDLSSGISSFTGNRLPNIIIVISLTKTFATPGIRLGCGIADASVVSRIEQFQPPWTVNTLAQRIGARALTDRDYVRRSVELVEEERAFLLSNLREIGGLFAFPSCANFILLRILEKDMTSSLLAERSLERCIAIRNCSNFHGLDSSFVRIAVRTRDENMRLVETLRRILGRPAPSVRSPRARTLMFQGTSSNAGKSLITAAFCRILAQDGHKVAPFKSQNISLNSFVTRDGHEMGRAQVFQAQACGIDPDVRMNPVLLKPHSNSGCQVIMMGKPVASKGTQTTGQYKNEAFKIACKAFDYLAERHDIVILEGAGSPAEVNLKHDDIANMKMARYAESPVIIVGDIDEGGIFASFIGTMEVFEEWERSLTMGFLINRFRGDASLLDPAVDYLRDFTGKPVVGVVPHINAPGLPDEDSVAFKSGLYDSGNVYDHHVDIAIIDLPHISNFTDFDALRNEPDVSLRIVSSAQRLGNPDAIIIPGSKSVIHDLDHLKVEGTASLIEQAFKDGSAEIIGVCGGLQMLGLQIRDEHHIESDVTETDGLGLLNLSTVMEPEKTLSYTEATHLESGLSVQGYEIHHGRTSSVGEKTGIRRQDGKALGYSSPDGSVWGTYLHGIFDSDEFRRWFINRLRRRRGLPPLTGVCASYDLEPAFERLAAIVRRNVNMKKIYEAMGL